MSLLGRLFRKRKNINLRGSIQLLAPASLFCTLIILGFFLPIYTDETCSKMIHARFFTNGGEQVSLFPQCTSSFRTKIPLALAPIRILDSAFFNHYENPLLLRLFGISQALVFLLLIVLISLKLNKRLGLLKSIFLTSAVFGTGVMPFLMALNRPEKLTMIFLALLILLWSYEPQTNSYTVALYITLVCLMLGSHPKASFLLPVVFTLGILLFKNNVLKLLLSFAAVVGILASNLKFWSDTVRCPEVPSIQETFRSFMLTPQLLFSEPAAFTRQAFLNLASTLSYFKPIEFSSNYLSDWLPSHPHLNYITATSNTVFLVVFTSLFLGMLSLALLATRRFLRTSRISERHLLLLAFVFSIVAFDAFQTAKFAYEAPYFVGLMVLAVVLGLDLVHGLNRILAKLEPLLTVLLVGSSVQLVLFFLPHASSAWIRGGDLPLQPLSISGFRSTNFNTEIRRAGALCGIENNQAFKHVIVDDLTYAAYSRTYQPIHVFYLLGWWAQGTGSIPEIMAVVASDGAITRCSRLPETLQKVSRQSGEYCCLPGVKAAR